MTMANSSSLPQAGDPKAIGRQLVQKAHNRDGLPEIFIGVFFLLMSSLTYLIMVLPRKSIGFYAAVLTASFVLPVLGFGSHSVFKWVRRRFLIERWGFVEYTLINRRRIALGIVLAALMNVVLFGVIPRLSQPDRWLLAGTGLFGGAVCAWGGRQPRFVFEGALMATTGLLVAFSGVSLDAGFVILFGFQGLLTLASGCVVFRRFMQQPIEQDD